MKMISFFLFPCNGAPVEWNWQGKPEVLGENPVPVPLCPPQIPHGLTRDRTRASAVRGRRLTAWAMARSLLRMLLRSCSSVQNNRIPVFISSMRMGFPTCYPDRRWEKMGHGRAFKYGSTGQLFWMNYSVAQKSLNWKHSSCSYRAMPVNL